MPAARRCRPPRSPWWSRRTIAFLMVMIHPWILITLPLLTVVGNGLVEAVANEKNVSRSTNTDIIILLGQHEDWIHGQVYETTRDGLHLVSHNRSIDSIVCDPLMASLQQSLPQYPTNVVCKANQLVDLRPFRFQHRHTTQNDFLPLATWTVPLRVPTGVGWMPPPIPTKYLTSNWKFYVWDNASAIGMWWDATNFSQESALSPILQSYMDRVLNQKSKFGNNTLQLEGELSDSGGMHRKFHQTLHVRLPETVPTMRAIVNILVLLPPDLFINIEEAIKTPTGSLLTRFRVLDVPPGRVIDQEEPSFVSPSHGVQLQIEFPAQQESLEINWDLLLHTRYPKPLQHADFSLLAMISPVLWSLQVVREDDTVASDVPCGWGKPDSIPHYTWVAAGRQEDFVPVMAITALVALTGCAVMLRALGKTTHSLR